MVTVHLYLMGVTNLEFKYRDALMRKLANGNELILPVCRVMQRLVAEIFSGSKL